MESRRSREIPHFSAIISAEIPCGTNPLAYRPSIFGPNGKPGPC